jgi:hypothetical protein
MIAHCCGHATIVARRQPLFGFYRSHPATRFDRSPFRAPRTARRSQLEGDRNRSFSSARFAGRRRATKLNLATRHASPRIAKRNSNHIPAATDRSIALRAMRAPKITAPDINRARSDHVIFVRPALFAPVFVTRGCGPPRARCRRSNRSYARRNNVVRILSQTFRSPREATDVLKARSQRCLSRHHIAPSLRKSAACTSSHGPVWLFFLRCG